MKFSRFPFPVEYPVWHLSIKYVCWRLITQSNNNCLWGHQDFQGYRGELKMPLQNSVKTDSCYLRILWWNNALLLFEHPQYWFNLFTVCNCIIIFMTKYCRRCNNSNVHYVVSLVYSYFHMFSCLGHAKLCLKSESFWKTKSWTYYPSITLDFVEIKESRNQGVPTCVSM